MTFMYMYMNEETNRHTYICTGHRDDGWSDGGRWTGDTGMGLVEG